MWEQLCKNIQNETAEKKEKNKKNPTTLLALTKTTTVISGTASLHVFLALFYVFCLLLDREPPASSSVSGISTRTYMVSTMFSPAQGNIRSSAPRHSQHVTLNGFGSSTTRLATLWSSPMHSRSSSHRSSSSLVRLAMSRAAFSSRYWSRIG